MVEPRKYQQCPICDTYDYVGDHTPTKCRDLVGENQAAMRGKADYWQRRYLHSLEKVEELEKRLSETLIKLANAETELGRITVLTDEE